MATVAPSSGEAASMLQKLSLESQGNPIEVPSQHPQKGSTSQQGNSESFVSVSGQSQSLERSVSSYPHDAMHPTMCFMPNSYPSPAFFYGSYNGSGNEWEDYSYVNTNGVEIAPGAFGDNGSYIYHNGYGYTPYAPYPPAISPVPPMGNDGQSYASQQYRYPLSFQQLTPNSCPFTPTQAVTSQGEASTSAPLEHKPVKADPPKKNNAGLSGADSRAGNGLSYQNRAPQNAPFDWNNTCGRGSMPGAVPGSSYQDPRFGFDGQHRSSNGVPFPKNGNVQSLRSHNFVNPNFMDFRGSGLISGVGSTHGFMDGLYPNKYYGQYQNAYRSGMGYGSYGYYPRMNTNGCLGFGGKPRPRDRAGYMSQSENIDGLNELNKGPRSKNSIKNQKSLSPVRILVKGQTIPTCEPASEAEAAEEASLVPNMEQYNKADFPEEYADAKFFIIKSYSEDDVHKSIKYSVWASTPNGNKKLDSAYQEALSKPEPCPVFLFFSVNTSGQFVGLAEMVGPVDFNRNVEYWQHDKWTGCFPVKWHIVKDIPNNILKHIILENNENKPVTNSRDTQEVNLENGVKMIKIFKDHSSKTSIFDDFEFYERRQKLIQERKANQQTHQQTLGNEKPFDSDAAGEEKQSESASRAEAEALEMNPSAPNLNVGPTFPEEAVSDPGVHLVSPGGYASTSEDHETETVLKLSADLNEVEILSE